MTTPKPPTPDPPAPSKEARAVLDEWGDRWPIADAEVADEEKGDLIWLIDAALRAERRRVIEELEPHCIHDQACLTPNDVMQEVLATHNSSLIRPCVCGLDRALSPEDPR